MSDANKIPKKRRRRKVYMPDGKEFTSEHLKVERIQKKALAAPRIPLLTNGGPDETVWAETSADAHWTRLGLYCQVGISLEESRKKGGRNAAAVKAPNIDERDTRVRSAYVAMTGTDERNRAAILAGKFDLSASQIRRILKKTRMR